MSDATGSAAASAQAALDKVEAAETLARFYAAVQHYDCDGSDFDAIEPLIGDEMVYLTSNLKDSAPVPRGAFLKRFKELHDVHAFDARGSFYALAGPVVTIDGDRAHLVGHISICHWLSPANQHSTWFYGVVAADLVRTASGWQIAMLDVSRVDRVEGHLPPVNAFHPHLVTQ
jgi:hypothetical protein